MIGIMAFLMGVLSSLLTTRDALPKRSLDTAITVRCIVRRLPLPARGSSRRTASSYRPDHNHPRCTSDPPPDALAGDARAGPGTASSTEWSEAGGIHAPPLPTEAVPAKVTIVVVVVVVVIIIAYLI